MSWSKNDEPRGYHHGNLREALMKAALEPDRRARRRPAPPSPRRRAAPGSSPAAPYRHFRDRDELLGRRRRVRLRAFRRRPEGRLERWPPEPGGGVRAHGPRLSRTSPVPIRRTMSPCSNPASPPMPTPRSPRLASAPSACCARPRRCWWRRCRRPAARRRLMVALHIWALAHGVASLFGRADGARRRVPMPPEELLEAGFLIYLKGLGDKPE